MDLGKLFWPDAGGVEQAGYRAVRDVPVLFDNNGQYRRVANRYLRERALSAWTPTQLSISYRAPARTTLESIARHLDDFLDWCDAKSKAWTDLSYGDLLSSYQEGLQSGETPTADGRSPAEL